jgi:hypothetical protein
VHTVRVNLYSPTSAKACGSLMSCIAAKRASPFCPCSFAFALRMDCIWRLSLCCFFFLLVFTP